MAVCHLPWAVVGDANEGVSRPADGSRQRCGGGQQVAPDPGENAMMVANRMR
jgi:hypothetical protein